MRTDGQQTSLKSTPRWKRFQVGGTLWRGCFHRELCPQHLNTWVPPRLVGFHLHALRDDLKAHLEELTGKQVVSQVHELASYVGFKGCFKEECSIGKPELSLAEDSGNDDDEGQGFKIEEMSDEVYPNNTPVLKLECDEAFQGLTAKEKLYAHHLSRAAWYGGLIVLFQTSKESPLIYIILDRLFRSQSLESLKALALSECEITEDEFKALLVYASAFYSNMGNYKGFGDNKFIPGLPKEKLHKLLTQSEAWKQDPTKMQFLWAEAGDLLYSLKDHEKHLGFPPKGSTTYFSKNCTEKDSELVSSVLKEKNMEAYITRVFKKVATEAGDADRFDIRHASVLSTEDNEWKETMGSNRLKSNLICFTRGDYSELLRLTVDCLKRAQEHAANDNQKQMLEKYVESFTVGSLDAHKDGSRFWIRDKGPSVESYIGFIETYRDPAGMRGEFEGFIAVVNKQQSEKFATLVSSAEKLLPLLPWPSAYEKDLFLRPDFTSLDVVTFAASGIPAGINIPNYDAIRQNEGFKNVSLGNVINATDETTKTNFLSPEDNDLFNKFKNKSFEVQVGLHELLGHGSGKLFKQEKGAFNFDKENVTIPETNQKVESWYTEGESYDSKFGSLGSTYEECRAECVGLYLCNNDDVLKIFGFSGQEADDVAYVNWLSMVAKGVEGLQTYNPHTKSWLQAHSQARYVIMRVLLEAGNLVEIKETTGEDDKPDLLVTLDRSKILTFGRPVIGRFLLKLQVYKSTGDIKAATELYNKYSEVSAEGQYPFLKYWDIVMDRKKPRRLFVFSNTVENGVNVELKNYEASVEGMIQSWMDRFASDAQKLEEIIISTWKKDKEYF
ncbi:dipeptidyl peptidase 3-like isoform X2 [Ornithodoros turicata]|uniref:dipeptidyl peptidase 3-like isoform X2 n=1 Tax=Ornithodoros turicata TaxID=34597 RepID=UPI0031397259